MSGQTPDKPPTRWWRAPLWHFVLIGAALYALDLALTDTDDHTPIVVPRAWLDARSAEIQASTGQPATEAQRQAAAQRYARDEALFREALSLGLHQSDLIVRRRLIQQIEFIHGDLALIEPPDDAALEAWLDAHPERLARPERRTFEHRLFSRDRRGDKAEEDAREALSLLHTTGEAPAGDPFMAGERFTWRTRQDVAGRFGPTFAEVAFELPTGRWSGPVASAYGVHLVKILDVAPGGAPKLGEVRAEVLAEVLAERRQAAAAAWEAALIERVGFTIESAP